MPDTVLPEFQRRMNDMATFVKELAINGRNITDVNNYGITWDS